jgi:hypothetical protein
MAEPRSITIEISPGELIDRMTILQIKTERIRDAQKLQRVRLELQALETVRHSALPPNPELEELIASLKAINGQLWEIEDAIRLQEHRKDFGPQFIGLARSIYRTNDRRSELKRRINELCGTTLSEEKAYPAYE